MNSKKKIIIILAALASLGVIGIVLASINGDAQSGEFGQGLLIIILFILAQAIVLIIAAAAGIVTGIQYLSKKLIGHQLPKWLTIVLFLIVTISIPAAYNAWQKSTTVKDSQKALAAITFKIFEPTAVPSNYKRSHVNAYGTRLNPDVEFFYLNTSVSTASQYGTLTIAETAEGPNMSKICNFDSPAGQYGLTESATSPCEFQTTPKGVVWYHGEGMYGGKISDFTVQNGTRVTVEHYGLTEGQLDQIFDGLVQKQAADIDVSKNAHDFNFLGIQFQY